MAIKQYYFIDGNGNHQNIGTANPEHQAEIEAHLLEWGVPTEETDGAGGFYVVVDEPFDLGPGPLV